MSYVKLDMVVTNCLLAVLAQSVPCELFCNQCCFTFPSKVFRAPFIEAKDLFLHEVLFFLMFSIDAQLEFCQGRGESHFLSHIKTIDVC